MNNRKLVGVVSIIVLAILFMSIGCGDGKRSTNANTRKIHAGVGGNNKDLAAKSAKLKSIEATMTGHADDGQLIAQQDIPAGSYTLTEVMGYVKYMRGIEDVRAVAIGSVTGTTIGSGPSDQTGMINKDSDSARTVEIPLTFTAQNGAVTPTGQGLYSLQLNLEGKIMHSLSTGGSSEIGILRAMAQAPNQTGTHTIALANGKQADIHVRKLLTGGIRISVTVQELKMAEKGKQNSTMIKRMAFTYRSSQPAAEPQPQQPQPGVPETLGTGAGGQQPPSIIRPEDINVNLSGAE
jgi:hypothetical protein